MSPRPGAPPGAPTNRSNGPNGPNGSRVVHCGAWAEIKLNGSMSIAMQQITRGQAIIGDFTLFFQFEGCG